MRPHAMHAMEDDNAAEGLWLMPAGLLVAPVAQHPSGYGG